MYNNNIKSKIQSSSASKNIFYAYSINNVFKNNISIISYGDNKQAQAQKINSIPPQSKIIFIIYYLLLFINYI